MSGPQSIRRNGVWGQCVPIQGQEDSCGIEWEGLRRTWRVLGHDEHDELRGVVIKSLGCQAENGSQGA